MKYIWILVCFMIIVFCYNNNYFDPFQNASVISITKIGPGPFITNTNHAFNIFNPGIINIDDKTLVVARISSASKCITTQEYKTNNNVNDAMNIFDPMYKNNSSLIITWYIERPDEFNVLNNYTSDCNKRHSLGLEDPRIFKYYNKIWIYAHYRGVENGTFIHKPVIFDMNTPNKLITLKYNNMNGFEKNWIPFVYDDNLYFEYTIHPHIILKCDTNTGNCLKVYETTFNNILKKDVGGGAPAQLITYNNKSYYLNIGHTRVHEPKFIRNSFFYIFNAQPPFNVLGLTKDFTIQNNDIEFATGLIVKRDKVTISVGIQDCYSILVEYDLKDIMDAMVML